MRFTLDASFPRVVFGVGSFGSIGAEAERLGVERVLVVGTPGRAILLDDAIRLLGARSAGIFGEAVPHVPSGIAARARECAVSAKSDCILAVGGGSAIGVAKAVALTTGLPIIAVPTTYSGSEMTPVWGLTEDAVKVTGRDARVQPRTVIYDPELTLGLSASTSVATGMNAIAHCVEALYAPDANPLTSMMAEEGISVLSHSLPLIADAPRDLGARTHALYGSWLAGSALGAVQMGLQHKLSHTLGGTFGLSHAETHAVLLPHTAAYNADAAREAMLRIARALGGDDAPGALFDLNRRIGSLASLAALGMQITELERAADLAVEKPYANPRPVTRDGVLGILRRAFDGERPSRQLT